MRLLPLPGVFTPHSDSWALAGRLAREYVGGRSVLDLCCGSGVLAITAALHGARETAAVDISRRSVIAVRLNGLLNGVRIEALRGDMFEPVSGRRFDIIVSNPPYVPSQSARLPQRGLSRAWEAGRRGRVFLDRICAQAKDHLTPDGFVLLIHSSICGERETLTALEGGGLLGEVVHRERSRLGVRLSERAAWLREQGLLEGDHEEILLIQARRTGKPPGERDRL